MWLWDSAFHAIGLRHLDVPVAREALEAVLDAQHPDGQVQISYHHRQGRESATQPPTLALAVGLVHEVRPEREWLARLYPKLAAYLEWDIRNRDVDGDGLLEWLCGENPRCRCGESGWDNSPRFDCAKPLNATDFNSFLALECEYLASFAAELGFCEEREKWTARQAALCRGMNEKLWNDDLGIYVDARADTGEQQPLLAASGFLPLICGAPDSTRARRLAQHLHNPRTFGVAVPLPSLSPRHREYSKDMWRGPMWVNINWLVARGFERCGLPEEARFLRERTLATIEKYYERYGVLFEFYDDEDKVPPPELLRKQRHDPNRWIHQVVHDYGWTAALYIDIRMDARAK
jgi:glycogen debranching enzyme